MENTQKRDKITKKKSNLDKNKLQSIKQRADTSSGGNITDTCLDAAVGHLKICKDKVTNFLKQEARMKNFNKTAGKKQTKRGLFAPIANKIIDVGGGNASNLSCGGTFGNPGAGNMSEILATLQGCETKVVKACDPAAYPLPPNMTKVEECSAMMKTYKTEVKKCMKLKGSEECSAMMKTYKTEVKKCMK